MKDITFGFCVVAMALTPCILWYIMEFVDEAIHRKWKIEDEERQLNKK